MVTIILISSNLFWTTILLYYRKKDLNCFNEFKNEVYYKLVHIQNKQNHNLDSLSYQFEKLSKFLVNSKNK